MRKLILILLSGFPALVNAGEGHHHNDGWEFGISISSVWLEEEDHSDQATSIHLHAISPFENEWFGHQFGYGAGIEAVLVYFPTDSFSFIISPGIEFLKHSDYDEHEAHSEHDDNFDHSFSMHYELVYTFEARDIHFGPVIGFSHNANGDDHYSLGLHFGF